MLNKKSVDDINVKAKEFWFVVISTYLCRMEKSQTRTVW